jgi:hypothetical protein
MASAAGGVGLSEPTRGGRFLCASLAVPMYPPVAVLSFWPFGDHGVSVFAVSWRRRST